MTTNPPQKEQRLATARQAADILSKRRKSKGLSQAQVASQLGVSQARVSTLESNPAALTLERLIMLAGLLDLEVVLRDRSKKVDSAGW